MFLIGLRIMLVVAIIGLVIFFIIKTIQKATLVSSRREELDEAKINIEETLKEAKVADRVKTTEDELEKAKEKIVGLKKKGRNANSKQRGKSNESVERVKDTD